MYNHTSSSNEYFLNLAPSMSLNTSITVHTCESKKEIEKIKSINLCLFSWSIFFKMWTNCSKIDTHYFKHLWTLVTWTVVLHLGSNFYSLTHLFSEWVAGVRDWTRNSRTWRLVIWKQLFKSLRPKIRNWTKGCLAGTVS